MTSTLSVIAAGAAGLSAYLLGGAGRIRLPAQVEPRPLGDERSALLRFRLVLSVLAFVGGWAFVGGVIGIGAGSAAGATAWVVLGRAESPAARRRRERIERDLPTGVDLLGSCLRAGGAVDAALLIVAEALGGPVGEEFRRIRQRLQLGVDPAAVWRDVGSDPQLGPLGRSISRAEETGASITGAIHRLAEELRARARAEVESRARSVEVKAAVPLGVCFLPAFVLLGVVPLVAGIFLSMSLFS